MSSATRGDQDHPASIDRRYGLLIVGMGYRAYDILTRWLGRHAVRRIPHYAARFPNARTRSHFAAEMARIRGEYRQM